MLSYKKVKTTDSINTTNTNNNRGFKMNARSSNSALPNRIQPDDETEEIAVDEAEKIREKIDKDEKVQDTLNDKSNGDSDDHDELEPFTPEELADSKKTKIEELETIIEIALACDPRKEEEGFFVHEIIYAALKVNKSYFSLERANEEESQLYRQDVAKLIVETNFIDLMQEICVWTFQNGWHDEDIDKQNKKFILLHCTLLALQNFTDASEFLAIQVASRPKMLQEFTSLIVKYTDRHLGKVEPKLEEKENDLLNCCVSIIHNLSMVEYNVNVLREEGLIDIMQPLLKSPSEILPVSALATLAGIINEQECDIINENKKLVMLLMHMLRMGLKTKDLRYKGWSCKECTFTIRLLARNDANKKLLVYLGALELLVNLCKIGNMEEKYQSAEAIWALSFDADNQSLITGNADLGVIEILMELKQVDCDKIKKACNGALWNMKEALRCTVIEKYREIGEKLNAQREVSDSAESRHLQKKTPGEETKDEERTSKLETTSDKHIMISYQWSHQAILKDIRDNLKACGYKVWMDIDKMVGSTVESMAHAVEGADIVLMCLSSKYKTSSPCRHEAEYAYQLKKTIIPLKMEQGYIPDGWLGFLTGAKTYYEFSGKYPFKNKMVDLLKAISDERKNTDSTDGEDILPSEIKVTHSIPPVAQQKTQAASSTSIIPRGISFVSIETVNIVRKWTSEDVQKWIQDNSLNGCKLDLLTGGEIALLMNMRFECPDYFYKCLESMLLVNDLLTMSRIVWALIDLNELKSDYSSEQSATP